MQFSTSIFGFLLLATTAIAAPQPQAMDPTCDQDRWYTSEQYCYDECTGVCEPAEGSPDLFWECHCTN